LIERPIPFPVTTLGVLIAAPPPWGVNVTVVVGEGVPAVKPPAVTLTGVFGLAVAGSIATSVILCAYKGVISSAATRRIRNAIARHLQIAEKRIRWVVGKGLPISRPRDIGC
jgi:hypothetical protein